MFLSFNPFLPSRHNKLESSLPIGPVNHFGHRKVNPSMEAPPYIIKGLRQLPRNVDSQMAKLFVESFILPAQESDASVSKAVYGVVQREIIGLRKDAFVAVSNGQFIGMITLNEEGQLEIPTGSAKLQGKPGAFLANLVVKESFRKSGIGKALCEKVEEQSLRLGYEDVYLCVEKDNTPAIKFYKKFGYRQFDVNTNAKIPRIVGGGLEFVPTTQIIMRKDLINPPGDGASDIPLVPIALVAVGLSAAGYIATGGFTQ